MNHSAIDPTVNAFSNTIILIPAYKPEPVLPSIAKRLSEAGFSLLIVDDGSGSNFTEIFDETSKYAEILSYEQNRGKGGALKAGLSHIYKNLPAMRYIVTADADGQHAFGDICAVAQRLHKQGGLVIGSRDFQGKIPFRSALGNNLSRFVYAIAAGRFIHDNQSGLRGFERNQIPWMLKVAGTKYDYEMNVLMYAAKTRLPIREHTIRTIYENNNACSHFNPIKDTGRIYKRLFAAAGITGASLILNFIITALLAPLMQEWNLPSELAVPIATVSSLLFAGLISLLPGILPFSFLTLAFLHIGTVSLLRAAARTLIASLLHRYGSIAFIAAYLLAILLVIPLEYLFRKGLFRLSEAGRAVAKAGREQKKQSS